MDLNFYIDPDHFPYHLSDKELNIDNKNIYTILSSGTWLPWTLRTYLELQDVSSFAKKYDLKLLDYIPKEGITIFFRGSILLNKKPSQKQFWICMVADATWHPYSHINIFQNYYNLKKYPNGYFLRLWSHLNLKKVEGNGPLKNIYFFGNTDNLAYELKTNDWRDFLEKHALNFIMPSRENWNDYTHADVVLAIRSFKSKDPFLQKPSSKLINAWIANAVFIGGEDCAFEYEKIFDFDYITISTYEQLKEKLICLKKNHLLLNKYRENSKNRGNQFKIDFFRDQWINFIDNEAVPAYIKWSDKTLFSHYIFLIKRFIIFKKKALSSRIYNIYTKP